MAREIHDTLAQGLTGIITQLQARRARRPPTADRRPARRGGDPSWPATACPRPGAPCTRCVPSRWRPPGSARRWREVARAVVGATRRPAHVTTTGAPRPMRPERRGRAAAHRAGGAGQRRQACARQPGRPDALLHGGRGRRSTCVTTASASTRQGLPRVRRDGGGFGLTAMRQRVEGLAGTLEIESEPGGGTAISACIRPRCRGTSPGQT